VLAALRRLRDAWRESGRRYREALDEEAVDEYFRGREEAEADVDEPLREPDEHLRRRRARRC
jgi:hypothetical protein